jgi:uncharacterized membrane protein
MANDNSYIGITPANLYDVHPTEQRQTIVCVGGETTFAALYTVGYLDVYLNGSKQQIGAEVTATNGTSFTFSVALSANDVVEYVYKTASSPYDYYTKAQLANGSAAALLGSSASGSLVSTNIQAALTELDSDLTAVDNSVVHKAGTETITGSKTFSSPIFTGTPVTPTASLGVSTTQLASTAFVDQNIRQKLQSVTCTQIAGALTFGLNPTVLDFRSTTLTTGVPVTRTSNATISLALPSGGTLGAVTTVQARLILVAIDNAGTVELAVVNITGGNNLDETQLISTNPITQTSTFTGVIAVTTGILTLSAVGTGTFALGQALSGTGVPSGTYVIALLSGTLGAAASTYSTNINVAVASTSMTGVAGIGFYSTTARTGVAYRVVGAVDAVNTAGVWASPVLVQPMGGEALSAMSSVGYGQTWQSVAITAGTTYYNTKGKPIFVSQQNTGNTITVNGQAVVSMTLSSSNTGMVLVPPSASYVFGGGNTAFILS